MSELVEAPFLLKKTKLKEGDVYDLDDIENSMLLVRVLGESDSTKTYRDASDGCNGQG